jgi:uncharacterized protein involved in outer membrane biogenesis
MKKIFNIVLVIFALVCVLLLGASFAVKVYLSNSRLRAMIIPPVEKALGRTVEIGQINVSLFSGVQVYDFVIKEANGLDDFISSTRFVVDYKVVPLLQGKFVINEVHFVDPSIHILRAEDGVFNFQSLVALAKKKQSVEQGEKDPSAADKSPLPFSVAVEQFVIENGMVSVRDELGILPETDIITNSEIQLGVGHSLSDYYYNGEIRFIVDTLYRDVNLHNDGRVTFDETRCDYTADIVIDEQNLQIAGSVDNYKSRYPPLIFNLYSAELDVDRLLQSLTQLGKTTDTSAGSDGVPGKTAKSKTADAAIIPPELNVHGEVLLKKVKVKDLVVEDLKLQFGLEDAQLSLADLGGRTLGGEISGEVAADLQGEPSYNGKLAAQAFQLGAIQKAYLPHSPAVMTGSVSGAVAFQGRGTDPEVIKKRLKATGEYSLQDGRISGSDVTRGLAAVLNMQELNDVPIKNMDGRFEVEKGKVRFNGSTDSVWFKAKAVGTIGLNGDLHVPVAMALSPRLSQQLDRRLEAAQYMEKQNGRTIVHLNIDGSVNKPRVSLDVQKTGKQAADKVIDTLLKDGSEEEKAAGEAVKSVLDNLFGQ